MNNSKKIRESGIELLRIYSIISVIILHYFNGGIGGGINYVHGTIANFIGRSFLTLSFCAVDLFIMISGYFLSASSKRSFSKIVFLLFQASFFRVVLLIVNSKINGGIITADGILRTALLYGYFVVFYSIIYLISPLINLGFDRLDKRNCKKAVIFLFVIFSVIPSIASVLSSYNVFGADWNGISTVTNAGSFEGYTIVNFFLAYVIGGYIRHWHSDEKKRIKMILLFFANTAALLIWGYISWQSAYTYDNPLVILEAALLLVIFKDIKWKSRIINEIASSGFTCYLIHSIFLDYIAIDQFASKSWYVLLAHVVVSAIVIYLVCYIIDKIYNLCFGWLVKILSPIIDKVNLTIYATDAKNNERISE